MKKSKKDLRSWANGFSACCLKTILLIWLVTIGYCMFVITYALVTTGEISEPITLLGEVCKIFSVSICTVLITRTIGNAFEYNDGGIWGRSHGGVEENSDDEIVG